MLNQFSRTQLLLGKEAMEKLQRSRVAVFGIGGVGGYVCEALVRSGVGAFDLIDDDKVCLTNLNRQIIATRKTVGKYKADVMKERMQEINPDVEVNVHRKIGPLATGATVSARRVQNINARSVGIFREVWVLFCQWIILLLLPITRNLWNWELIL